MSGDQLSLRLFHGRSHPDERLEDWGFEGPVLGPLDGIHLTYRNVGVFDDEGKRVDLPSVDDVLFYGGSYFGDASISTAAAQPPTEQVDEKRTRVPPSMKTLERPQIVLPDRLWGEYLRRVEVFVDSIRELAGDHTADAARAALLRLGQR